MKSLRIVLMLLIAVALIATAAYAAGGDAKKGEMLFKDAKFAGGKKSCDECHPNGRGLEKSGMKKTFNIMGGTQNSLEEAVNACIVNANKGKAIKADSKEMKNMVAYIMSLGGAKPKAGGY